MQDQQAKLTKRNIAAAKLISTLTSSEEREAIEDIRDKAPELIYVTPERLENQDYPVCPSLRRSRFDRNLCPGSRTGRQACSRDSLVSAARRLRKIRDVRDEVELAVFLGEYEQRHACDRERLDAMIRYRTTMCRVRHLSDYFHEQVNVDCGHCDNCRTGAMHRRVDTEALDKSRFIRRRPPRLRKVNR